MHHSIIDGVSGMGLAEVLLDVEADPPPRDLDVRESLHDLRQPGPIELLIRGAVNAATATPVRVTRFGLQTFRQALALTGLPGIGDATLPLSAPRTSLNGDLTPHRRLAWSSVPLPRVKAMKDAIFTSLATDVDDPVARLEAIHHSTQTAKGMQRAMSVHRIVGLTETTPPGLIGLAARTYTRSGLSRMSPPVNVVAGTTSPWPS